MVTCSKAEFVLNTVVVKTLVSLNDTKNRNKNCDFITNIFNIFQILTDDQKDLFIRI